MSAADDWDAIPSSGASQAGNTATDWNAIPSSPKTSTNSTVPASDLDNFMAGAGKAVVDMGRGTKQILDIPATWIEKKFPNISAWASEKTGLPTAQSSADQTNANVAESRALDAPLMNTKAGISGNIVSNVATTLIPLAGVAGSGARAASAAKALLNPTTYKAAATAGGLQGLLQPTTEDESKVKNAGVGALFGMGGNAIVNTVGRIAQPIAQSLSDAQSKAVKTLEGYGINLDAAQKTGSTILNKIRSSFSDNPFTAGAQSEQAAVQKGAYNKAVLSTIGENSPAATPDVMNAAASRIDGVFKDVLNRNDVKVPDAVLSKIASIQAAANEEEKAPVASIANRFINSVTTNDTVPGQTAYNIKKDLDRLASSPDTTLGYHAKQLRSTIMDAINDSLTSEDKAAFAEARNQFSNMKKIEPAIAKDGSGDISAPRLANVMAQKANRNASIYGRGDQALVDLAHSGNLLLPDKTPNSGSMARGAMQIALPLVAGGAQGAATGDWEGAAKTAASLYAIPKAAQFLMNNPSSANYISNGMQGSLTPIRNILQSPQTNQLVGGTMRRLPEAFNISKQRN